MVRRMVWMNLCRLGLFLALAVGLIACAMQSTGRAPRSTGMGRGDNPVDISSFGLREIEGRLERVEGDFLVIVADHGEMRLLTNEETAVFLDGGTAAITDLEAGTPVRASFSEEGGSPVLHWIEVPRPEDAKESSKHFENPGSEVAQ